MASRITSGPRSAADATRFTSTRPQPQSKTSAAPPPPPRPQQPPRRPGPSTGTGTAVGGETMEQRVQRLRAAHLAARNAPVSWMDTVLARSRRLLDTTHRITIAGLVGLTAITGVYTAYAVYDMAKFNRKRRADFIEAQRKMEADELATARIAFLKGEATPEQVALVEHTIREAEAQGTKLPPLLSAPSKSDPDKAKSLFGQVDDKVQAETAGATTTAAAAAVAAQEAAKEKTEEMRRKVKEVFEKEKENQREGGILDQLGLESGKERVASASSAAAPTGNSKSWWRWW